MMSGESGDEDGGGGGDKVKKKDENIEKPKDQTASNTNNRNEPRTYPKNYYSDNVSIKEYKVIIQKKYIPNTRLSISELQIGDILYRKMKIGEKIADIQKIGRNKVLIICKDRITANELVDSEMLAEKNLEAFISFTFVSRTAVIKNVDVEYTEQELKDNIDSRQYNILDVKRMNRRKFDNGSFTMEPSQSVKIFFEGSDFPKYVFMWGVRLNCEPFIPPLIQCFNCLRYNHITKQCKSKQVCKICGSKDENHSCSNNVQCINCHGEHRADSPSCPEKSRQKSIKEFMAFQNVTHLEAARLIPRSNNENFAIVTSNRYQELDNIYDENSFPQLGSRHKPKESDTQQLLEPFQPNAADRRRFDVNKRQFQNKTKRRRSPSKDDSPTKNMQTGKRQYTPKATQEEFLKRREENKQRLGVTGHLAGMSHLNQNRNYGRYEKKDDMKMKGYEMVMDTSNSSSSTTTVIERASESNDEINIDPILSTGSNGENILPQLPSYGS